VRRRASVGVDDDLAAGEPGVSGGPPDTNEPEGLMRTLVLIVINSRGITSEIAWPTRAWTSGCAPGWCWCETTMLSTATGFPSR